MFILFLARFSSSSLFRLVRAARVAAAKQQPSLLPLCVMYIPAMRFRRRRGSSTRVPYCRQKPTWVYSCRACCGEKPSRARGGGAQYYGCCAAKTKRQRMTFGKILCDMNIVCALFSNVGVATSFIFYWFALATAFQCGIVVMWSVVPSANRRRRMAWAGGHAWQHGVVNWRNNIA